MGLIAGWMWLMAALVGIAGQFLPGAPAGHRQGVIFLGAAVALYALASIAGLIDWGRIPLRWHAVATLAGIGVAGYALWLTGGAGTYFTPILICALLYISFFYPPRYAWPLSVALVLAGISPLFYAPGYAPRALVIAASFLSVTLIMLRLKDRLAESERRQREIALHDALTGVGNRRAFDQDLAAQLRQLRLSRRGNDELAVLFFDVDRFKTINDKHGHPVGDRVLRDFAAACRRSVRPGDKLSRIGGDEFALIAPGAGGEGAARLVRAMWDAAESVCVAPGADPVRVTVSYAIFPRDGETSLELMAAADKRLHDGKRRGATTAPAAEARSRSAREARSRSARAGAGT